MPVPRRVAAAQLAGGDEVLALGREAFGDGSGRLKVSDDVYGTESQGISQTGATLTAKEGRAVDEESQFEQAMAGVKPLKTVTRADTALPAKSALQSAARRQAAEAENMPERNYLSDHCAEPVSPFDIIGFVRPGVQHGVYGKLRRGRYAVEASLDLHRMTVVQARVEVWNFLRRASAEQLRTVMILHGKGDRSPRGAVLKSFVAQWLQQLPEVLAYHSALPAQGGAGALYVLLKKSEAARERNRERYRK